MKYEALREYKQTLRARELSESTIKTYYNKLDNLLEGQYFIESGKDLDLEKVLNNLSKIKYKSPFSQAKNSLLYFLEFSNIELTDEQKATIKKLETKTTKKYRKSPSEQIKYKKIKNTINRIKNEKLKINFQTLIETGLRVSELSQITTDNCKITDTYIMFLFIGKGGNNEIAVIKKENNNQLYKRLKDMIEKTSIKYSDTKVFYSANYLQQKAKKYNFTCHDLRRISAKLEYKKTKDKNAVKEKLRHSKEKTTNIYLNSKIDIKE